MTYNEAIKAITAGNIKKFIIFSGEDDYLKSKGVSAAVQAMDISLPEMNLFTLDDKAEVTAIVRAAETLPLMSERKAVIIKNTDRLSATSSADFANALAAAEIPDTNTVIISVNGKADKRKAFIKQVQKEGMFVECAKPDERSLANFAVAAFLEHNLMISRSNAELLCGHCDGDLFTLENEIKKLASVCRGNVTAEDIEKYANKSLQYNVFRIHDTFCAKNRKAAKKLVDMLLAEDPNPIGFISLISGNFKQMLVARACRDAGFDERRIINSIKGETGAKDWVAKRALQNCRGFSADSLRAAIKLLGEVDYGAKQGEYVLKTDLFAILTRIYDVHTA